MIGLALRTRTHPVRGKGRAHLSRAATTIPIFFQPVRRTRASLKGDRMSASRRLPARPSLEQLRKQAKESSRADAIPLAEAQFRLAQEYE